MAGKNVIITGANIGIGYETAIELAKRGARVILACRDSKKGETAVDQIKTLTKSDTIELELLDLGSLASIRDFAGRINGKLDKLDVLVNNAGMCAAEKRETTSDGFERTFGVNHLGPFLLTNLLLDLLKKSAPSRVVNLASEAHRMAKLDFDNLQLEKDYGEFKAYGSSKLANVLFSAELNRRLQGTNVSTVSLHPGIVKSQLFRDNKGIIGAMIGGFYSLFAKSTNRGAKSSVHCATHDEIPSKSGLYYGDNAKVIQPTNDAKNMETARRLWDVSAKLVGMEEQ